MLSRPSVAPAAAAVVALLALGGCSGLGNAERGNAGEAARQFAGAVEDDPAAACHLLAPETLKKLEDDKGSCVQALPQQDVGTSTDVTSVNVYAKDAVVHSGDDTLFLARFDDGWRVTAAGCTPVPDRPYDCTVEGK